MSPYPITFLSNLMRNRIFWFGIGAYLIAGVASMFYFILVEQRTSTLRNEETRQVLLRTIDTTSSLTERISKNQPKIISSVEILDKLIFQKRDLVVSASDVDSRRQYLEEVNTLTIVKSTLLSEVELSSAQIDFLSEVQKALTGILPYKSNRQLSKYLIPFLGVHSAYAETSPKPPERPIVDAPPTDNTSFIFVFRTYAQIVLVGLVLIVLCILAIMSARFAFAVVAVVNAEALAQQLENKKFAQDMVKTLVGFFAGMVTGILVGK